MCKLPQAAWLIIAAAALAGCRNRPPQIRPVSSPCPPAATTPARTPTAIQTRPGGEPGWATPAHPPWLPLADWAAFNRFERPRPIADRSGPAFQIRTPTGDMTVTADQQAVVWDGIACWLSYAPKVVAGQLSVHTMDAQHTLQPLLQRDCPAFPHGRTVVLDPGHGGKDVGARTASGQGREKDFVLDWALRTAPLLAAAGWTVVLTRTNDSSWSIAERIAVADRTRAHLFVSLHFNSAPPGSILRGIETYCLTPVGLPSNLVREGADDPRQVHPNNAHDTLNLFWAFRLHTALVRHTGAPDRGLRRSRYPGVLRRQNRPAVLIEAGYLSHPDEARRIATPRYRQILAEAVASALNGANQRLLSHTRNPF
ncbi:MAG: N-acetylmuramoyl-L-alanine amidase [Verrucomicrobia bacterium]|nr:N-acetylmuramoyl-L-alanine amidase [Verrucomicrobiota bacterium]